MEPAGYSATRHQREVGTGYFDQVSDVITGGEGSTLALRGSTEEAQFEAWKASADRKSTRLNSSHLGISYAVFCLKKKKQDKQKKKRTSYRLNLHGSSARLEPNGAAKNRPKWFRDYRDAGAQSADSKRQRPGTRQP